ncbi:hypothetical protein [Providencia hangzhouensis]|uniref:hypothetical protein n=1 Tax=Providencia hangzhouensis TaxID=3031799 RepID=UPI0034DCE2E2
MIIGVISDIHIGSNHDKEVLATSIKNINHCGAEGLLMAGILVIIINIEKILLIFS